MNHYQHILTAENLCFAYRRQQPVLCDVSINASPGRVLCLLGPNGSGKTTLLRCLLGLLKPDSGSISIDGKSLSDYPRKSLARMLAYVPQFPTSAFAFTVRELVLMGRFAHTPVLGLHNRHDLDVAREAMKMTQTQDFADRTLDELSGGEAQCVMIARALAQQPSVMLLDEPTSHLDVANQLKIYRMMQRLAHDWRMAVICVSHDINLAARFADQIILMRAGKIIADGPCSQILRENLLRQTYGVQIKLIPTPNQSTPIIWAD